MLEDSIDRMHVMKDTAHDRGKVAAFDREYDSHFRAYLERHSNELRAVDLGLAAFVCVTSIEALAHTAGLHRAEMASAETTGALVEETAPLVICYLQ